MRIQKLNKHLRRSFLQKYLNGFQPLTILAKNFILDVWLGSEYASRSVFGATSYLRC